MSNEDMRARVAAAIEKLPQWLRHDLGASDPALRERAQESLTAMILAAVEAGNGAMDGAPPA